jgi:spoIIIJ-associated protein
MIEKIKSITREFFQKAGFDAEISISEEENSFQINLKSDDPQTLIGSNGQTLVEIQKLLRSVIKHGVSEEVFIDLDVNGYKQKKAEYLKETALEAANEVFLSQKEKALLPMSSYERRIIHMALVNRSDVKVESVGEDPNRKIVIKPTLS